MNNDDAKKLTDTTRTIIGTFIKHQTETTTRGMDEITDLVRKIAPGSGLSDEETKPFNTALLDLALIGFVTVESVKKGMDKIMDPEPITDKDARELRTIIDARKQGDDKPKGGGGLNFL